MEVNPREIEIIKAIIERRKELGLSQRDLAELSGIKQPAIARIESMKSSPQINTLIRIVKSLGMEIKLCRIREE